MTRYCKYPFLVKYKKGNIKERACVDLAGPGNATAAIFCFWRRVSMLEWAGLIPVHFIKRVW